MFHPRKNFSNYHGKLYQKAALNYGNAFGMLLYMFSTDLEFGK